MVVDTGCFSSLVALHLSCQSIWEGQSSIGVVGGINHILDHDQYVLLSKSGGLSKKGQCSAWDAEADGFVRGEGAGVVLLKPLDQAEKDGDHIFSVIRGTSMNNNGYNVNLPAASINGQREMLEDAYAGSGISPDQLHYVEAHGTGTKLGDPAETKAIGSFFARGRSSDKALRLGSVKTNIGHLEGAAGIAGLIKVVLAMKHRTLPKSLNFNQPNPEIPFEELKVQVQQNVEAWPAMDNELLTAGVNSFGWGGTNAHTVLQEYRQPNMVHHNVPEYDKDQYIFNLSAKTERALQDYLKEYKTFLQEEVNGNLGHFRNIYMATTIRKPALDYRVSLNATSKQELIEKIDFILEEQSPMEAVRINPNTKVAFIFPGPGSQWIGMGRELMQKEPVFKKELEACERAFEPHIDWSLFEQLQAAESESRMKEINVIQPALFAIKVALAKLWQSWGIVPDAVVGHSKGKLPLPIYPAPSPSKMPQM